MFGTAASYPIPLAAPPTGAVIDGVTICVRVAWGTRAVGDTRLHATWAVTGA